MKKLLVFLLLLTTFSLQAQTIGAQAFSSAASSAGKVMFVIGQQFFEQKANADLLEVSLGVSQAQIIRDTLIEETCDNIGYEENNFYYPAPLPAGNYKDTNYNWNAVFKYDSITYLDLTSHETYEGWDTFYLYVWDLGPWKEGDNDSTFLSIHGCDSLMHIFVHTCGDVVQDADGNDYNSVFIGHYCWTQQNLHTRHYIGEADTVPNMIYKSPSFPNEEANLNQYGRLYTWYAAVNVPEGSAETPARDADGFVRGICPEGWHIPTEPNMRRLLEEDADALKSTNLWIHPGTNASGFTAYPAGLYNSSYGRFENMLIETHFWSDVIESSNSAYNATIEDDCLFTLWNAKNKSNGFSVRCVKNI